MTRISTHAATSPNRTTGPRTRVNLPVLAASAAITLALCGCQTTDPYTGEQKTSNTAKGTGIGAIGGAIAGAIIGGGKRKGVLIGAGIGALTGAAVGNYAPSCKAPASA
jgi:uncharacterized membrane protein